MRAYCLWDGAPVILLYYTRPDRTDNREMTGHEIDLHNREIMTPAWVVDEKQLKAGLGAVKAIAERAGCRLLFALKACSLLPALELIAPEVAGFSARSLFESVLGRQMAGQEGTVHVTAPGLRPDEAEVLAHLCDYFSFNSISQWKRLGYKMSRRVRCGLRVNPQVSFVRDLRCDPRRESSRLGVPLAELSATDEMPGVTGIHVHANCDSRDTGEFLAVIRKIDASIEPLLRRMGWINVGGGYLLNEANDLGGFYEGVAFLKEKYGLDVLMEPGSAVVRKGIVLVTAVTDVFERDGKQIAVLDTSINHMPEIFEYGFRPLVQEEDREGGFSCVLGGATCLSGDLFGEYTFGKRLVPGMKLTFGGMGSYTAVKATMFHGLNLPSLYVLREDGRLDLIRRFTYADFIARSGARLKLEGNALSFSSFWSK